MISIVKIHLTLAVILSCGGILSRGYIIDDRSSFESGKLKTISEWKTVDFIFPSENHRREAIRQQNFIEGNAVPIDVDIHYKVNPNDSRIFITLPRFRDGIPITLGVRSKRRAIDGSHMIEPYPDYSWHENVDAPGACDRKILSVFRIAIDPCERLWVLDTGKLGLANAPQTCPPKLLVFNLNTNQLIHRYTFPASQYSSISLYVNPIVDILDPQSRLCLHSRAYIADVSGFDVIVYDSPTDSSWVVRNKFFYPEPLFGTHTIARETFELMDGVFSMAAEKLNFGAANANRALYFHALASDKEYSVPISALANRTAWTTDENAYTNAFKIVGTKGSQSAASTMDSNGNLFLSLNNINAIACWDISRKTFTQPSLKVLVRDDEKLQFQSGMKVIRNTDGEEELWVVTNRFQRIMTGTMRNSDVNFRIQAQRTQRLMKGSRCG